MSMRVSSRRLYDTFVGSSAWEAAGSGQTGALSSYGYLRPFLELLWQHRTSAAGCMVLALFVSAVEALEPLIVRLIVDDVLLGADLGREARFEMLQLAAGALAASVVIARLAKTWKEYRQRLLTVRLTLSLRRSLFGRLMALPLQRLATMKVGGILARLTADVEATARLSHVLVLSPTTALARLLIIVAVLVFLNWRMALIAVTVVPSIVLVSFALSSRVRPVYRSIHKDGEAMEGRAGEVFSGVRVVRAFGREVRERMAYVVRRHTVARKELFAYRREVAVWTAWGLLTGGVNVAIVWYGGLLNLRGRASVGDVMAFQWYTVMLMAPVWEIVNTFSDIQRSLVAAERVYDVIRAHPDKPDIPGAVDAPDRVDEIRFENVEFYYDTGEPVIRGLDLAVPGGSVVALVGRSGAGKTTLTDLVARFYDPTSGRILINGTDIRHIALRRYRKMLAIVQQEVFLFDGPVRDNIAYGRPDASDQQIEAAARRANAHEFIVRLPEGYGTEIGERGLKLSGGQKQRLAIARAILANPQLLILDEATSNIDSESEELIRASMASLLAERTTFVIAHRLSTIRNADLILLLDGGRVVERGTHGALMRARGEYYAMVCRQRDLASAESSDNHLAEVV